MKSYKLQDIIRYMLKHKSCCLIVVMFLAINVPDASGDTENGKTIHAQLCSLYHAIDGKGDLAFPIEGSV